MFRYEWKKLTRQKTFWAVALLLIFMNLGSLIFSQQKTDTYHYVYQQKEAYKEFQQGKTKIEGIDFYRKDQKQQEQYRESYDTFRNEMAQRIQKMSTIGIFSGKNTYCARNLKKTGQDYRGISDIQIQEDNCYGVRAFSQYNLGILFCILFLLVLSWYLFFCERNNGLFLLLKGTKKGHIPLIWTKLAVMCVLSTIYTVLQEGSTLFVIAFLYGYGDGNRSIQSVPEFRNCPYAWSVNEALLATVGVRLVITLVLVGLLYGMSIWLRNEFVAFIGTAAIFLSSFWMSHFLSITGSLSIFKCLNPFYCWNMRNLFGTYYNLNIFGYAIGKNVCAYVIGLLLFTWCVIAGMHHFHVSCQIRTNSFLEKIYLWIRKKTGGLNHHASLFIWENKKIFVKQKKGVVLLLCLFMCVSSIYSAQKTMRYAKADKAMYHTCLKQIAGPVTKESMGYIEKQEKNLEHLYDRLEKEEDENKRIQIEQKILLRQDGIEMLSMQKNCLKEKEGNIYKKYWVDEWSYRYIWDSITDEVLVTAMGLLFVVIWISGIYSSDQRRDFTLLLQSTKKGRESLKRCKNVCAMGGALLIFCLSELPLFFRYYKIDGFASSAQKLCDFTTIQMTSQWTLGELVLGMFLLKFVLFFVMAVATLYVSRRTKSEMVTSLLCCGCIVVLAAICILFHWDFNYFLRTFR